MKIIFVSVFVIFLISPHLAMADVDTMLSFLPKEDNLSEGWLISPPQGASDFKIKSNNETIDGIVQQFELPNEDSTPSAILVTFSIFEFRTSDVSSQMYQTTEDKLQQIESIPIGFADSPQWECYGIIENNELPNEKSTVSCSADEFVIISTSEQDGPVYEGQKRAYTAATSVAFTEFVIQNIMDEKPLLPQWIKNNAEWWSQGIISDDEFAQTMEFLIEQGIIQIPEPVIASNSTPGKIPEWLKISAGWWSHGAISDEEFVQSLQFLIRDGIIAI